MVTEKVSLTLWEIYIQGLREQSAEDNIFEAREIK
jgi:hypothetical protein